jgi:hypothetical protein
VGITKKKSAWACSPGHFAVMAVAGLGSELVRLNWPNPLGVPVPSRYEKGSTNQKVPIRLQFHGGATNFTK